MTESIRNVDVLIIIWSALQKCEFLFYFIFYETYPYSSIDKKRTKGFFFVCFFLKQSSFFLFLLIQYITYSDIYTTK